MLKPTLTTLAALALVAAPMAPAVADSPTDAPAAASVHPASVTDLDHLDLLLDSVPLLPGVAGHTSYRIAQEPSAQAPWVYANR
jgi:hypothetical protein